MNIANIGKGGALPPSLAKKSGPQKEPSTEPTKARGAQRAQDTAQLVDRAFRRDARRDEGGVTLF